MRTQEQAQEYWEQSRASVLRGLRGVIYATGAFRVYADGDLFRPLMRWWHPVTWLIWGMMLPVAIVASAFSSFTVISIYSEMSFRPVPYFRNNPEQLFFVK